jgi:hypothetical protein
MCLDPYIRVHCRGFQLSNDVVQPGLQPILIWIQLTSPYAGPELLPRSTTHFIACSGFSLRIFRFRALYRREKPSGIKSPRVSTSATRDSSSKAILNWYKEKSFDARIWWESLFRWTMKLRSLSRSIFFSSHLDVGLKWRDLLARNLLRTKPSKRGTCRQLPRVLSMSWPSPSLDLPWSISDMGFSWFQGRPGQKCLKSYPQSTLRLASTIKSRGNRSLFQSHEVITMTRRCRYGPPTQGARAGRDSGKESVSYGIRFIITEIIQYVQVVLYLHMLPTASTLQALQLPAEYQSYPFRLNRHGV